MAIRNVRLGLKKKTNSDLSTFATSVVSHINGNAFFATPTPPLASISTAASQFQTAIDAWGEKGNRGSHNDHEVLLSKRVALSNLLSQCGNYVEGVANDPASVVDGPEVIITSAGMEVKSLPADLGMLPAPQNVRKILRYTIPEGSLQVRWNKVKGAGSYIVKRSDDGITFAIAGYATKTLFEDSGLTPGSQYTYTITAVGAAGEGVVSDPCIARAF